MVARQLQERFANRATRTLDDEHDVQDLFRALLKIDFEEIRTEEWTPSYAGGSARMDFVLKRERIVVEVKKTRPSLTARAIADELIVDIARYKRYADCRTLVCFIYDPEFRIGNPSGLARDLNGAHEELDVRVVISPGGSSEGF
jgi:hypothetical protein